ncbi:MAG TPA: multidrug efflux SMR transporter [Solirubrobacter sp.]|nr:multidrug efflux SMR transporter [Solirubrobacter sp.]
MTAIYLALAIASEVIGTLALKASDGFSKLLPAAVVVVGYGLSFWLLALVLKHMSVGTTYAVWSAVGTAAIAVIGILAYGEGANLLKVASLGLIILGVVGLNAAGAH